MRAFLKFIVGALNTFVVAFGTGAVGAALWLTFVSGWDWVDGWWPL